MATSERDPEAVRTGATIRALREAHGLKVGELAKAIGISSFHMSNVESGTKNATPAVCRKVADTLGIPLAAITVRDYERIADKPSRQDIPA